MEGKTIKKSTSLLLAQSQQKKNTMDDDNLASILTAAVHYLKLRDVIHDGSKEKDKLQLHGKGGAAQTHSACFIEKRLLIAKTAAAMAAVGAAVGAMAVGAVGVGAVGVAVGAAVTLSSCILQPAFVGVASPLEESGDDVTSELVVSQPVGNHEYAVIKGGIYLFVQSWKSSHNKQPPDKIASLSRTLSSLVHDSTILMRQSTSTIIVSNLSGRGGLCLANLLSSHPGLRPWSWGWAPLGGLLSINY